MKTLSKKQKIAVIAIAAVTAVVIILGATLGWYYGIYTNVYYGSTTKPPEPRELSEVLSEKEAQADLDYVISRLRERHPAWIEEDRTTADKIESVYKNELAKIDGPRTVLEVWQAAAKICCVFDNDAHTAVRHYSETKYIDDLSDVFSYGYPVTINGIDTEKLLDDNRDILSYETEDYLRNLYYGNYIVSEKYLKFLGQDTSGGVEFSFANGITKHYSFVDYEDVKGKKPQTQGGKWVDYNIDTDKNLAVFTLKQCNYNDEYRTTVNKFFKAIKENGITNIAVDLRGNGGGNSGVANEFIAYLDAYSYMTNAKNVRIANSLKFYPKSEIKVNKSELSYSGKVFVMTDFNTFSAATDFAMLIADNGLGKVVGKPSGNLPDCYIDIIQYALPNSKLSFTVSFKHAYRLDESKSGKPIEPDYPCAPSEALDTVYSLIA